MIPVTEKLHCRRLNEKNIVIEDIFWVGDKERSDVWIRATDGLRHDNVLCKKRKEKRYFFNNKCIYVEKKFPKNAEYTILSGTSGNEIISCPNCGNSGAAKEFYDGCPFCGTTFNVQYEKKGLSVEDFTEIAHSKITWILAVVTVVAIYAYTILTNSIGLEDIILFIVAAPLVILGVFLIILLLSVPFVIVRLMIILISYYDNVNILPIRNKVYSDLITELSYYYYDTNRAPRYANLIDFDIVGFNNFELVKNNAGVTYSKISYKIRKVYFKKGKIKTDTKKAYARLIKSEVKTTDKRGFIICKNCGASIDLLAQKCEYCHTPNGHKTEWVVTNIDKL